MKKANNEMKTIFPSRSWNESYARMAMAAFVTQLDPLVEELSELKTAVSEAVTNAIVHGYGDALGPVTLKVRLLPERVVELTVSDKGCGIENIEQAREPLFTSCDTGERAGMGFTIMESFCDGLRVRSLKGKGTVVVMKKKLSERGALAPNLR